VWRTSAVTPQRIVCAGPRRSWADASTKNFGPAAGASGAITATYEIVIKRVWLRKAVYEAGR